MKFNKYLAIVLVFACVAMIAACGNDNNGADTANAGGNNAGNEDKQVTITFWHHYSTASPEEKTLTDVLIPKFESEHPNIQVDAVAFPWDELHKKLQLGGSVGDLPDVARLDIIWVPELQEAGLLQSLDQEFADFNEIAEGLLEGPLSTGKVGDHYYGLPLNTNTKVMFWNQDMLEQSGMTQPPATADEFFNALAALQLDPGKSWGFGEPALQGWNILPWIWSNGGDVLSPDFATAEGYLNGQATVDILSKLREAYQAGYISGFNPGDVAVTEGHAQGNYAMIAEGPWAVAQFDSQFPDFEAQMSLFPAGSAGSIQVLGGEDLGIFSKDKKEQAWEFVKFMVSEAAQVEMGKVGQIPVNKAAMEHADVASIDYYGPFLEQLQTAKARPPVAEWPLIDTVLSDTMGKIFLTDVDIPSALDDAVKQIDDILNR